MERRVEEACLNAWPALREVLLGGWLLRFSAGLTRRANSANALTGAAKAHADEIEPLYHRMGQPAIFRVPTLLDPSVDKELERLGYTSEGESRVLYGSLDDMKASDDSEVMLLSQPSPEWFAAMAALQGHSSEQARAYRSIVDQLAIPARFAIAFSEGEPAAAAYGALHRDLLCFESVITGGQRRRQGYGRRIVMALAAWAKEAGAGGACLEVEADNLPAHALYDEVGLRGELYRYHYRREPRAPVVAKL